MHAFWLLRRHGPAAWLTLALALTLLDSSAWADDVVRVEEDWQLVVNQPDVNLNGPQVTCVLSPSTMDQAYFAVDINYHTQPGYLAGGLQMHAWNPGLPIVTCDFPDQGLMQTSNETVTWTQSMALADGVLTYSVFNGQSQTWGSFGGEQIVVSTTMGNLNSYDPQVSTTNSGVCFASNLVNTLTLVAVRYYAKDGTLLQQVTNPQVVFSQD